MAGGEISSTRASFPFPRFHFSVAPRSGWVAPPFHIFFARVVSWDRVLPLPPPGPPRFRYFDLERMRTAPRPKTLFLPCRKTFIILLVSSLASARLKCYSLSCRGTPYARASGWGSLYCAEEKELPKCGILSHCRYDCNEEAFIVCPCFMIFPGGG